MSADRMSDDRTRVRPANHLKEGYRDKWKLRNDRMCPQNLPSVLIITLGRNGTRIRRIATYRTDQSALICHDPSNPLTILVWRDLVPSSLQSAIPDASHDQLERQLNLARSTSTANHTEIAAADLCARAVELRGVEGAEHFHAELHVVVLFTAEVIVFEERDVPQLCPRIAHVGQCAWRAAKSEGWGGRKLRNVEPPIDAVIGRAAFDPRALTCPVGALPRTEDASVVLALRNDQRRAALVRRDAVNLPPADDAIDQRGRVPEQLLAAACGQFVDIAEDQPLRHVLGRDRAFSATVVRVLLVARWPEKGDCLRNVINQFAFSVSNEQAQAIRE